MKSTFMHPPAIRSVIVVVFAVLTLAPPDDGEARAGEGDSPALQKPLSEASRRELITHLGAFAKAPPQSTRDFVQVEMKSAMDPTFPTVPDGWFAWTTPVEWVGRHIVLDEGDFRLILRFTPKPEEPAVSSGTILVERSFDANGNEVLRSAEFRRGKGDTQFIEHRLFFQGDRCLAVSMEVFDFPTGRKTIADMIGHLRKHYGEFNGICAQVSSLLAKGR